MGDQVRIGFYDDFRSCLLPDQGVIDISTAVQDLPPGSPQLQPSRAEEVDRLATEAGRDPRSIEVIAFGLYPKDIDQIPVYLDAGADRVVFRFETTPRDEALEQLDRVAEQIFV
jgi:hypothetical protein